MLYFHRRPPYSWLDDSSNVVRVVAEPTERALVAAKIDFTWAALPSARQMETIEKGEEFACALGWWRDATIGAFSASRRSHSSWP